jgi:hypothetical protein
VNEDEAGTVWVPERLAPEARELLLGFWEWTMNHQSLLASEEWTMEQMIDLFLLEAAEG